MRFAPRSRPADGLISAGVLGRESLAPVEAGGYFLRSMKRWLQEARSKGLHYAVAILIIAVLIAWGKVMER